MLCTLHEMDLLQRWPRHVCNLDKLHQMSLGKTYVDDKLNLTIMTTNVKKISELKSKIIDFNIYSLIFYFILGNVVLVDAVVNKFVVNVTYSMIILHLASITEQNVVNQVYTNIEYAQPPCIICNSISNWQKEAQKSLLLIASLINFVVSSTWISINYLVMSVFLIGCVR